MERQRPTMPEMLSHGQPRERLAQYGERTRVTCRTDAANLLLAEMMGYEQEHFVALMLNTPSQVLAMPTIYKGTVKSLTIRMRKRGCG